MPATISRIASAIIRKLAAEELKASRRDAGEIAKAITLMDSHRRASTGIATGD